MISFRIIVVAVCVVLLSCCYQNAFAGDNGVFKLELPDAAAVGMGDAFVGEADRPSAVYYNPAGIVQMDTIEASAGLTWLQPQIKFESLASNNGGTSEMKEDNYLFPDFFVTAPIIKDKFYLGLGENSNFGAGNDWEANGFSQYETIKDSISDQDYMIVGAYKLTDQWSFGAGATDDQSEFEHDLAIPQTSYENGNALFKANDNAWGFDLATMFKLNDQNQFGLDYKSPIHHQYSGTLYLSDLNSAGLGSGYPYFGGSSFSTKAIQKLTLPQSLTFGYSVKPIDKLTVNFDLEWTDWTQYKQQITYYPNVSSAAQLGVLGLNNPQARDWASVWAESIGAQYEVTDKFRVRLGYSHHQSPIATNDYDTAFPDADSNSVSAGFGYDITSKLTIDVAYVASFYLPRSIVNSVGDASPLDPLLSGRYSEFVNIGTMSLTYKF